MRPHALACLLLALPIHAQDEVRLEDPGEHAPQRRPGDERTLALYEVADLTGLAELEPLELAGLADAGPAQAQALLEQVQAHKARAEQIHAVAETLRDTVRSYMEPAFDEPRHDLRLMNDGALLLLGEPEQHAWVDAFLHRQRATTGYVELAARILTVPAGSMEGLGVRGSVEVYEGPEAIDPLLRALEALPGVVSVSAPRLVTAPRQRANIMNVNQVAYIKDYELQVIEPGDVEIADPVIDVVQEGITFDILAVPIADDVFGVDVELTSATLTRPIQTVTLQIGAGRHEVEVGLPEVTQVGLKSRLSLRDGAVAVLITPDQTRDVDVVITVQLRHLEEPELVRELGPGSGDQRRK